MHPSDGPVFDDRVLASPERLRAVTDVGLLDTADERSFDRWTTRATELTSAGTALVSLVDASRCFFKSFRLSDGTAGAGREMPISISLCREVVVRGEPLIVDDASLDPRTKDYGAVRAFPLGAYAGMPLRSAGGHVLGSFSVVDPAPREWTDDQVAVLADLTAAVETELRLCAAVRHNRRHEALDETHRRIHALMRGGESRTAVLAELVTGIERQTDGMQGSIALTRAQSPGDGAQEGSSTAARNGADVIAADPATADRQPALRSSASTTGPAWGWAVPIVGALGRSRGAFALWGDEPRALLFQDVALLNQAARLASIVLERDEASRELLRLATRDPLTGLPNRAWLLDRLADRLRGAADGRAVAVLSCDLDRFKLINDSLGHHAGDAVLVEVARRLTQGLRAEDLLARLGGDEFVVVLAGVHDQGAAEDCAGRLEQELAAPIRATDGRWHVVHASIGIALVEAASAQEALRRADNAMHDVKRTSARVGMYDSTVDAASSRELRMLDALHGALDRDELHLVFQPLISLTDGTVSGVEALVRWSHQELGDVGPGHFIPLAEEHGLIADIGGWVISEAIAQAARWRSADGKLGVSVNLSAHQLDDPALASGILATLIAADVPAGDLTVEITETAALADEPVATRNLTRLREAGVKVLLDDFGTGFSSLTHLRTLPITGLKIDRSFIAQYPERPTDMALVQGLVAMADGLGLDVIAEGVETAQQAEALRELGCPYGQGYYFARPARADQLAADRISART